jgi:Na+-driven multidrug efflux pump
MVAFICCLILNLFPHVFYKIYASSESFTEEAIPVMRVVTLAILMMSQGAIWLNAILGTGLTRINLSIEAVTVGAYLFYTYCAVRFVHHPLVWAWGSELLYWGILWSGSWMFFRFFPWMERYKK